MPSTLFWPPSAFDLPEGREEAPGKSLADQRPAVAKTGLDKADRLRAEVAALNQVIKDRKDGYDLARK